MIAKLKKSLLATSILIPICLIFILTCTPGISFSEDLGRHLLFGEIILEKGYIPKINLLTYTYRDFPFINHHWLSQVVLYLLHSLVGFNGMILFKMFLFSITLYFSLTVVTIKRHHWLIWISGMMSVIILTYRAHLRPELFSFLFIALLLFIFEECRKGNKFFRWLLVPIMILWVNMHIYFIFGIGMIGAFAIENILTRINSSCKNKKYIWYEFCWLFSLIIITLVNPNGIDGLLYPFNIFSNYGVNIVENCSPLELWESVINPMLMVLPFLSIVTLLAIFYELWHWWKCRDNNRLNSIRVSNIIIALAAVFASWIMARNTPLLAISALPVIASATNKIPTLHNFPKTIKTLRSIIYTSLFIITIFIITIVVNGSFYRIFPSPIGPTPFGFDPSPERWHSISKLIAKFKNSDTGNIFTDYNIGSLVEYEIYPQKGYVDNRPEAFPLKFWENEYFPALSLGEKWNETCLKRDINLIIVSLTGVPSTFIQELHSRKEWTLIYLDENCVVLIKNIKKNEDIISELQFDKNKIEQFEREISERLLDLPNISWRKRQAEVNIIVFRLYALICIGENIRAWPYIYQLFQLYPNYQNIHELIMVTAPPEKIDAITSIFESRAHYPLSVKEVTNFSNHLLVTGEREKALQVLYRGRFFFPLSPILKKVPVRKSSKESLKRLVL